MGARLHRFAWRGTKVPRGRGRCKTDPLSVDNKIIWANWSADRHPLVSTGRYTVITKGPLMAPLPAPIRAATGVPSSRRAGT